MDSITPASEPQLENHNQYKKTLKALAVGNSRNPGGEDIGNMTGANNIDKIDALAGC
jgi:hypothetical protein